jgi:hypothetical protein
MTGPKISSLAIFMLSLTSAKTVGSIKKPRLPTRLPPASSDAPSGLSRFDVTHHFFELDVVHLGTLFGSGVEGVAHLASFLARATLFSTNSS